MNLPNNIQIELVEGCNRMCSFCGIHSIWNKKEHMVIKSMSLYLAKKIAVGLKDWGFISKRIEFAMHGEPTLHKDVVEIISFYRKTLPKSQLQLTTNGLELIKKGGNFIVEMFNGGLNFLIVDMYTKKEEIEFVCKESGIKIQRYYDENQSNPYHYNGQANKIIMLMDDIGERNGERAARKILNHAGNSNVDNLKKIGILPLKSPLVKKCSRPFREIVIHYDGTIPICCLDWRHEFIIGKFPEDGTFAEIWEGGCFSAVRRLLYDKNRTFRPCYRCDYNGGFRLGLLPQPDEFKNIDLLKIVSTHIIKNKKYNHPNTVDDIFYKSNQKSFFNCKGKI